MPDDTIRSTLSIEQIRNLGPTCGTKTAVAITGLCPRTVNRGAVNGTLPAKKVANRWIFNVAKLCELCGIEL